MRKVPDLTGQKFNRLTVLERSESRNNKAFWKCSCECGNTVYACTTGLKRSNTGSCGCLREEKRRESKNRKYNPYINHGDHCEIFSKNGSFLIDSDDLERVLGFAFWCVRIPRPGRGKRDQINVCCGRGSASLSRFILNVNEKDIKVDHRDHNRLDNRKSNLRKSTDAQNQGNRGLREDNVSGYKGVSYKKKNGKFQAQFTYTVDGKRFTKYLGIYEDPADGARAYDAYAISYFGEEFARPNFQQNSSNVSV